MSRRTQVLRPISREVLRHNEALILFTAFTATPRVIVCGSLDKIFEKTEKKRIDI